MPPLSFSSSHPNSGTTSLSIPNPHSFSPRLQRQPQQQRRQRPPPPPSPSPSEPSYYYQTRSLQTSPRPGPFPIQDLRIGIDSAAAAANSPPSPPRQLLLVLLALLPLGFIAFGLIGWWWRGYLKLVDSRGYNPALHETEVREMAFGDVLPVAGNVPSSRKGRKSVTGIGKKSVRVMARIEEEEEEGEKEEKEEEKGKDVAGD